MDARTKPAPRGRPRDPEVDRQILDAARVLLAQGGYEALSFETISQATGIPRSMIYRRWPTKVQIANEIASGGDTPFPDVIADDGLYGQVLALVRQVLGRYADPAIGAAAVGVIAATQGNRVLQGELQAQAEGDARATLRTIVARGRDAGLVRHDTDADVLFDTIVGTLVYRALFSLCDVPEGYAETFSRQIVAGLAPPGVTAA